MKRQTLYAIAVFCLLLTACSGNPFAPDKHQPTEEIILPPAPAATSPELVMDNLNKAMNERDKDLYESLIDDNFWFTEADCAGELVWFNGKEGELEFIGGSRDGSQPGLFDIYRNFDFDFELISRTVELGLGHPNAFEGDPDGHPDEDWEVFRGRVKMLMVDENQDGFRVDQVMTYKLRESEEVVPADTTATGEILPEQKLWKITRWIDDPLSGDCGDLAEDGADAKPVAGAPSLGTPAFSSWAHLKGSATE